MMSNESIEINCKFDLLIEYRFVVLNQILSCYQIYLMMNDSFSFVSFSLIIIMTTAARMIFVHNDKNLMARIVFYSFFGLCLLWRMKIHTSFWLQLDQLKKKRKINTFDYIFCSNSPMIMMMIMEMMPWFTVNNWIATNHPLVCHVSFW